MDGFELTTQTIKLLPEKLKLLRKEKNISQVMMGKKIRAEQGHISGMERKPPKGKSLLYLIKYLKVIGHKLIIVPNGIEESLPESS